MLVNELEGLAGDQWFPSSGCGSWELVARGTCLEKAMEESKQEASAG